MSENRTDLESGSVIGYDGLGEVIECGTAAYQHFDQRDTSSTKVVLKPNGNRAKDSKR